MENREFIAANKLPEIEAETVDVLCVDPETGEMGKKSGAALGGGSTVDGIIANNNFPLYIGDNNVSVVSFDFDMIKEKILSGEEVVVMLHSVYTYGDNYETWCKSVGTVYNSTKDTISAVWLAASNYSSGNAGTANITITIDSSGAIVDVHRD